MNTYVALGMGFSVEVRDPACAAPVTELLRIFEAPATSNAAHRYRIDVDGAGVRSLTRDRELLTSDVSWARVVATLMADINRHVIDAFDGFAVHAGVVALAGDVLAFPGASGTGKSTLTAACLDAGFAYVSDEALCVDHGTGAVIAYPRPIALSPDGWRLARSGGVPSGGVDAGAEVLLTAAKLDVPVARKTLRLAHVAQPTRSEGAARLVPLPRSRALVSLMEMSFNHYKQPEASFRVASRLAEQARAWRLEYSDPRQAAALLRAELTRSG
jgi:hypothetical protein